MVRGKRRIKKVIRMWGRERGVGRDKLNKDELWKEIKNIRE